MRLDAINEQLLRALGAGVAILRRDGLTVRFCNATFAEWFSDPAVGSSIAGAMPDLDLAAVTEALESSGRYACELTLRRRRRTLVIAATLTRAEDELVLLECQNVTRIRELESMIDSYSAMVERNARELQREKERVEKLLLNIMPRSVYDEYKAFGVVTPQRYMNVSVLALDFVGFLERAAEVTPGVVISETNDIFTAFDRIGEQFGCERIKTAGDTYMCVAGLPEPLEDHMRAIANAALRLLRYLDRRNESHPQRWHCRIGLASGSVIGSVVGVQRYVFDMFGDAVTEAVALRDRAEPMQILCAGAMRDALAPEFAIGAPATGAPSDPDAAFVLAREGQRVSPDGR